MRFPVLFIFAVLMLTSCFKKDEALTPGQWDGEAYAFDKSIYYSQFFFSLSNNSVIAENSNEDWDIAFESARNGWHIRINSGNLLVIGKTGITDFNQTTFPNPGKWLYDKSDGDPDSTAVGKWVDTSGSSNSYTNEVYIIAKYNGTDYIPLKKVLFYLVSDTSYKMKYADIDGSSMTDKTIEKDTVFNQVYFSLTTNTTVSIEPPKKNWDLLFSQYTTTLVTSEGVFVPYFVRGVLINPYKVAVALDSINNFGSITLNNALSANLSTSLDIIGHNWKSVEIDQQSNTARYAVRDNYSYIIRDVNSIFYKLKFTSFFNDKRTPGYPAFIFLELE